MRGRPRSALGTAGLATLTLALAWAGLSLSPATAANKTTIRVGDNFFQPQTKKVRRGALVRFRWIGDRPHNVTLTKRPRGVRRFASETTSRKGVNFRRKFRKPGGYTLVCTLHQGMQMRLRVRKRR